MSNNCCMRTDGVALVDKLDDIRDNIDIVADLHPANEYEILERTSNKLTDIINELKQKGAL